LLFIRHPLVAQDEETALKVGETTMQKIVSLIPEQTGSTSPATRKFTWHAASTAHRSRSWPIQELEISRAIAAGSRDARPRPAINVTRFFRDVKSGRFAWRAFAGDLEARGRAKSARIWVPGLRTVRGLLDRHSRARTRDGLCPSGCEKCRDRRGWFPSTTPVSGFYPIASRGCSPELLARFFCSERGACQSVQSFASRSSLRGRMSARSPGFHQGRSDLMPQPAHRICGPTRRKK